MRELSDDECMAIAGPECTVLSSFGYELVRAAYAAGYAAAQPGPPDHQPAATSSPATRAAAFPVAAQAVTDGPAADPIADLCARLRDEYEGCPSPVTTARVATLREAADALERQASEIADLNRAWKAMLDRAERAEAERDTLRKCLKSVVSAWDDDYKPT